MSFASQAGRQVTPPTHPPQLPCAVWSLWFCHNNRIKCA